MKLTATLHAFVLVGLLLVLTVFGVFSYQREVRQFESDMRQDAAVLGNALASAASYAWQTAGEGRARGLVAEAGGGESLIRVRWIGSGQVPPPGEIAGPGRSVTVREPGGSGERGVYTYVPVVGPANELAAIELFEPLSELDAHTRESARNLVIMAVTLVLVAAVFVGVVGVNLIGKRVQELVRHAHRIGEGDLASRVRIRGRDEITTLSDALNRMGSDLQESRNRLVEETSSRIRVLEQLRHTERVATLGQLSAGMAHEMGTPLNVISGRAKLIATTEPLDDEARESSRIIADQADRMADTIRQFLDYGRRVKAKKAPADVLEIIGNVVKMLEPAAAEQGVTLKLQGGRDIPPATVDRAQIQQVFMNLIRNAIQSMPGGGTVGVVIERETEPGHADTCRHVVIRVEDQGVGIPPANLERIFEPFYSTKGSGQGVGLGLSIVQGIVEDHGGRITVESKPGEGSCFRIRLPLRGSDGAGS